MGTMGVLGAFGSLLGGHSDSATVVECRRCGTTLNDADEQCPACGGEHVAEFDIA